MVEVPTKEEFSVLVEKVVNIETLLNGFNEGLGELKQIVDAIQVSVPVEFPQNVKDALTTILTYLQS